MPTPDRLDDDGPGRVDGSVEHAPAASEFSAPDVARLELGQIPKPRTDTLAAIAKALDLSLSELLGIGMPESLPSFRPYMRTKYPSMPDEALAEIDAYVTRLNEQYRISPDGPLDDEDEQEE